ncbi:unnamed protein product [Polarella glacialis]|uniref:FHA domain-containing protein n=1 Tax=Polarella glacialis TaxID=89957 RepID=A0A813JE89_POLGL|nr:unnamed protein product [Polarella glacialis]
MAVSIPAWSAIPEQCDFWLEGTCLKSGSVDVGKRRSYVIGSSLECDIQLVDASVMAEHAMLAHHRNGLAYLVDLGSDAGTSVDGIRLEPNALWRLKSGCSIVLGHAPALLLKGGQLLSHRELLRSARSSCGEQEGQGTAPKSRQNSELPSRKRSCAAVQEVMESTEANDEDKDLRPPPKRRRALPAGARVFFNDTVDEIEPDSGICGD